MTEQVTLTLSRDEAIVFYEWLTRFKQVSSRDCPDSLSCELTKLSNHLWTERHAALSGHARNGLAG